MNTAELKRLTGEQINKMTMAELKEVAKDATRFTKQRLSNLGNKYTPAKTKLYKNVGKETLPKEKEIDTMSQGELRHLLKSETNFLQSKTSTLEGERQRIRNFIRGSIDTKGKTSKQIENLITRRINKLGGYWELGEVFDMIDQVEELEPSLVYELGSGTEDEKGFIGQVIESYSSDDFQSLLDDPVKFTQKLKEKIDNEKRKKDKDFSFK